jgi:5-methylcytosine-specific restriction endonuclease McrA
MVRMSTLSPAVAQLSDQDLVAEVQRLAASERQAVARMIVLLIELDARRLYLREGYGSLFAYCTECLHLTEAASYLRIEAARVAVRFPLVLERFAEGTLTLTAIHLLGPHLTDDNQRAVLDAARHQSKYIPAPIKREVWRREGGRCAYVSPDAKRCEARGFLEFHHRRPHAAGGRATVANLTILCVAHHALHTEQELGPDSRNHARPDVAGAERPTRSGPSREGPGSWRRGGRNVRADPGRS